MANWTPSGGEPVFYNKSNDPDAKIQYEPNHFAITVSGYLRVAGYSSIAEALFNFIKNSTQNDLKDRCEDAYSRLKNLFDNNKIHIRVAGKENYNSGKNIIIHIDHYPGVQYPVSLSKANLSRAGDGWTKYQNKSDKDIIDEIDQCIVDNQYSPEEAIKEILTKHATDNPYVPALNDNPTIKVVKV